MTEIGSTAPNFVLKDQFGNDFELFKECSKQPVVLFFYPGDYTPICTLENIAFREAYHQFKQAGAEVVGVSDNSMQTHQSFCTALKLQFRLLTDPGHRVRNSFNVKGVLGWNTTRVTYVIDTERHIRMIFKANFKAGQHAAQALQVVCGLGEECLGAA
jgi:peroxiredoxin Q/BCP